MHSYFYNTVSILKSRRALFIPLEQAGDFPHPLPSTVLTHRHPVPLEQALPSLPSSPQVCFLCLYPKLQRLVLFCLCNLFPEPMQPSWLTSFRAHFFYLCDFLNQVMVVCGGGGETALLDLEELNGYCFPFPKNGCSLV